MANYTQKLIIDTFNEMLDRMPFDKITVTALIKECQIGRNTFYYHYQDIYELLDEALGGVVKGSYRVNFGSVVAGCCQGDTLFMRRAQEEDLQRLQLSIA